MKLVISWMSWSLILLAGLVSCTVVTGRWGGSPPPAPDKPVAVTTPATRPTGMPMGVPQTVAFDPGSIEEETRTPRQRDDQARDWLMWVVATSLVPDAGLLSDMLFDAPVARKGHLQAASRMDYGTTRAFVLPDGDVVALVPKADAAQREDDLAQVFDDQRRNLASVPARIHVYEYALTGLRTATITRRPALDGKTFLTPENGYYTALVTNGGQLQSFLERTDDLLAAEVTAQGLKVSGRRMNASYRNIESTEVAALGQAAEAVKKARNGEFAQEVSALEAKFSMKFQAFHTSMPREDVLEDMGRIGAEEQRLQREIAAAYHALTARYIAAGKTVPVGGTGFSLDPTYDHAALADGLESNPTLQAILATSTEDKRKFTDALAALRQPHGYEGRLLELGGDLAKRKNDLPAEVARGIIELNLKKFGLQQARYDGPLGGTEAGMILFYTDLLAKLWALNYQNSTPTAAIPDFAPYIRTNFSHVYDAEIVESNRTRIWFGPENSGFEAAGNRQLLMGRTATRIYAASTDPFKLGKEGEPNAWASAFIDWWNDHYDEVARYEPEYQRLNQLMKWSLLIAWLEHSDRSAQLGFLASLNVDPSAWFSEWMRKHTGLRFHQWEKSNDPFKSKGYLGRRTELMDLLASDVVVANSRQGDKVVKGPIQLSGGVSLGSTDKFASRSGTTAAFPAHQRRAGLDRVEGTGTVKLSGNRTPVYVFPTRDRQMGAATAHRATQRMTPFKGAKLRGPHGDMSHAPFERRLDRIGDRTVVRMRVSDIDLGTLAIDPVPDGFRVSWNSRDTDAAYVLGRRLSERPDHWLDVLDDPAVAHAARTDKGEYYVNLQGSDRWILLSPQKQTVPDIAAGWHGRVSAESPHAPTFQLRWVTSGLPAGVRDQAHWVRGPPPAGALGLRLPSQGTTAAQDAAQIADDPVGWRSRKRAEVEATIASLDTMAERSPRAAVDRGLEAQAALGQRPELLLREAINELRQQHVPAALAAMNRTLAVRPRQKLALLDEVNTRLAGLQGGPRDGLATFRDALERQVKGTLPAGSELRMVETDSDGPGIGAELRLGDEAFAQRADAAPNTARHDGHLYVQDSVALNTMDWGNAPQAAVDGVIRAGVGKAASIPVGALGDYRPHRIVVDNIVYIDRGSRADGLLEPNGTTVPRLAGSGGDDDCPKQDAPCEEDRIYMIQATPAVARR